MNADAKAIADQLIAAKTPAAQERAAQKLAAIIERAREENPTEYLQLVRELTEIVRDLRKATEAALAK